VSLADLEPASEKCPPTEAADAADRERPADDYSPRIFPRISFMSPGGGTGGHAGASEGKEWLQMRLFEVEGDDPA
jgi:hypothetical protein